MSSVFQQVHRFAAVALMLSFGVLWFWLMAQVMAMAGPPVLTDPTPTAADLAREGMLGRGLSVDPDDSSLYFTAPESGE